jgi:hypothetical protein
MPRADGRRLNEVPEAEFERTYKTASGVLERRFVVSVFSRAISCRKTEQRGPAAEAIRLTAA